MSEKNQINDYIVYGIRKLGTNRYIYIGISQIRSNWSVIKTAEKRLIKHFGEARRRTHYNKLLQNLFIMNNFCFGIDVLYVLHNFDLKQARVQESFVIKEFELKGNKLVNLIKDNNGWNVCKSENFYTKPIRKKSRGSGNRAVAKYGYKKNFKSVQKSRI